MMEDTPALRANWLIQRVKICVPFARELISELTPKPIIESIKNKGHPNI